MSQRRKDRFRTPFAHAFLRVLSWLPLRFSQALGAALGACAAWIPNRARQVSAANVALCLPDLSPREQQRLVRRSLMEAGKGVGELGACWLWPTGKLMGLAAQVSGQDIVDTAVEKHNGVIFALPHLGAWEFLGPYLGYHYQILGMGKPLKMLDELVAAARSRTGARVVATNTAGVRRLFKALKNGESIVVLPDQVTDADEGAGVFAPFFGIAADTNVLIPNLVLRTKAVVVFAFAERLPKGGGYHVHFRANPPLEGQPSVEAMARHINEGLEHCIRSLPTQYVWSYKRFRGSPDLPASPY